MCARACKFWFSGVFTKNIKAVFNILNTNNKPMNIIETEAREIKDTLYFDKDKNIKVISKMDKDLNELWNVLAVAAKDIDSKLLKVEAIRDSLNAAYRARNSNEIIECLWDSVQVVEYMNTYTKNSVGDLGKDTTKNRVFDIDQYMND